MSMIPRELSLNAVLSPIPAREGAPSLMERSSSSFTASATNQESPTLTATFSLDSAARKQLTTSTLIGSSQSNSPVQSGSPSLSSSNKTSCGMLCLNFNKQKANENKAISVEKPAEMRRTSSESQCIIPAESLQQPFIDKTAIAAVEKEIKQNIEMLTSFSSAEKCVALRNKVKEYVALWQEAPSQPAKILMKEYCDKCLPSFKAFATFYLGEHQGKGGTDQELAFSVANSLLLSSSLIERLSLAEEVYQQTFIHWSKLTQQAKEFSLYFENEVLSQKGAVPSESFLQQAAIILQAATQMHAEFLPLSGPRSERLQQALNEIEKLQKILMLSKALMQRNLFEFFEQAFLSLPVKRIPTPTQLALIEANPDLRKSLLIIEKNYRRKGGCAKNLAKPSENLKDVALEHALLRNLFAENGIWAHLMDIMPLMIAQEARIETIYLFLGKEMQQAARDYTREKVLAEINGLKEAQYKKMIAFLNIEIAGSKITLEGKNFQQELKCYAQTLKDKTTLQGTNLIHQITTSLIPEKMGEITNQMVRFNENLVRLNELYQINCLEHKELDRLHMLLEKCQKAWGRAQTRLQFADSFSYKLTLRT